MKNEQEWTIYQDGFALKGTLSLPEEATDVAFLIIPGSGEVDRNGNSKKFKAGLYKDLADFFADIGIAAIRYDKRGVGKSEGVYLETGLTEFIEDAAEWLRTIKKSGLFRKVFVLGHSEGAIIGPAVLTQESADGLIFLCGSSGTGAELLLYQNELIKKEVRETRGVKGLLFKLLQVEKRISKQTQAVRQKVFSTSDPVVKYRGLKLNAKWLREMNAFNLLDYLSGISGDFLAIEGKRDIQVKQGSAQWFAGHTGGELFVIDDMNHLLRKREEPHSLLGLQKEYKQSLQEEPLHPFLLQHLKEWIHSIRDKNTTEY